MKKAMNHCVKAVSLLALLALAGVASADTLLVDRVQQENAVTVPAR